MIHRILALLMLSSLVGALGRAVWAQDTVASSSNAEGREFFEKEVRPLLIKRCFECHGGRESKGGLSLASAKGWMVGGESGPAIIPREPEKSLLIDAIHYRSMEMPPAEAGGKLSPEEISVLTKWVAMGAPDPRDGVEVLGGMTREEATRWWAFQPLPKIPVENISDDVNHIDHLLEQEIEKRGLKKAPLADRTILLRRLTYGLTGLPPSADDRERVMTDESPDVFSKMIDRLLDSPQYGAHWGRRWLDVVRYADTAGENTDRPLPHAWRYRNWVIDAFCRDLPFDQFVRLQLAGDLITRDHDTASRSEGIVATGYLAIARRFGHDIDKDMYLTHEDVIDNIGKNFLGLTLGCARCHDHKYDPISAEDYYALYGIFESTRFAFPGCEPKGQPRDLVPLLPQEEIDAIMKPWREQQEQWRLVTQRREEVAKGIFTNDTIQATKLIQKSPVPEGESVELGETQISVTIGDVVLLTVEPGDNHGADSTLVDLHLRELGGQRRQWSTSDILDDFAISNPQDAKEATWCFIEPTPGSCSYLLEGQDQINGLKDLKKWSLGDVPSVFVNVSEKSLKVWTELSARSLFCHPGPKRPVSIAWVSPCSGMLAIRGRVADVHPAPLDGVAFRLEHIARPKTGAQLIELGKASTTTVSSSLSEPVIPVAYAVIDRDAKNARLQPRGDPKELGPEVTRRWLSVFGGAEVPIGAGSGRRELADWITTNPLMARVMVNRIWEWHFGRGLVRSSNDFGTRGETPSHPELLDFLAVRFVQSGYSVKAMHRLILQSDAYRRASDVPASADPENRWLSHFSRRRLTAEELRDSLLMLSGELDPSAGEAHPFPEEKTWKFTQHQPFNANYETNRRSIYMMVQRQRRHPFLALFDGADPNASTPVRQSTTVPTQALYFINDPFFHAQAAKVAKRWEIESDQESRLVQAYRMLFQREPTPSERDRLLRFLGDYPDERVGKWAALARVLLASNEFLFVE